MAKAGEENPRSQGFEISSQMKVSEIVHIRRLVWLFLEFEFPRVSLIVCGARPPVALYRCIPAQQLI